MGRRAFQLKKEPIPQVERQRAELDKPLVVLNANENEGPRTLFGYAKNISRGGMMIGSLNPKEPGSRYDLEFALPGTVKRLGRCYCEVVWKRSLADKAHAPGMGLKFLELSPTTEAALRGWLESFSSRSLVLLSLLALPPQLKNLRHTQPPEDRRGEILAFAVVADAQTRPHDLQRLLGDATRRTQRHDLVPRQRTIDEHFE